MKLSDLPSPMDVKIIKRDDSEYSIKLPDEKVLKIKSSTSPLERDIWINTAINGNTFSTFTQNSSGLYNTLKSCFEVYKTAIENYGHSFILEENDKVIAVLPCCRLRLIYDTNRELFNRLVDLEADLLDSDVQSSRSRHEVEKTLIKLVKSKDILCYALFYNSHNGQIYNSMFKAVKTMYKGYRVILGVGTRGEAKEFSKNGYKSRQVANNYYLIE